MLGSKTVTFRPKSIAGGPDLSATPLAVAAVAMVVVALAVGAETIRVSVTAIVIAPRRRRRVAVEFLTAR